MGRPANITLTATRARARQIHPRVLILNAMLFTVAGTVTIALFTAAVCLVNGWGLLPGIVMGAAGAAAAG